VVKSILRASGNFRDADGNRARPELEHHGDDGVAGRGTAGVDREVCSARPREPSLPRADWRGFRSPRGDYRRRAIRACSRGHLFKKLASDLTAKLGRGFSERNLEQMRRFFLTWSISQTPSAKSLPAPDGAHRIPQTVSATSRAAAPLAGLPVFPLPWSH
jgi:hypothetical protein